MKDCLLSVPFSIFASLNSQLAVKAGDFKLAGTSEINCLPFSVG